MRSSTITIELRNDVAVIRLFGTIEIHHSDRIRQVTTDLIETKGFRRLVISLQGVSSVASSALGVFLTLMEMYRDTVSFRYCGLSKAVEAVFAAASLYDFFPVDATLKQSVERFENAVAH